MSGGLYCPYCGGDQLDEFETGLSEYSHSCAKCGAAFAIDKAAGTVKTRRWDRQAARGIHEEFSLDRMLAPPDQVSQ